MARKNCQTCGRAQAVCLCPWLQKIENPINLTVLRHGSEVDHALNTVEIIKSCLTNITVIDGEVFEPISGAVLIYPGETAKPLEDVSFESPAKTYILLDGTWRKTRKMIYLNPWLMDLPQVTLPALKSNYILRKKSPEGFSTLEAAVSLFTQLEQNTPKYEPLLLAMQQMLKYQIEFMGEETFEKHFKDRL